jgi:putative nucleotidyltransferase with HDIG domain
MEDYKMIQKAITLMTKTMEENTSLSTHKPEHKFHDRSTFDHIKSVMEAAKAKFDAGEISEAVYTAAILHDIGKIKALLETGKMFKHEKIGAEMVTEEGFPKVVANLIALHGYRRDADQVSPKKAKKKVRKAAEEAGVDYNTFITYMEQLDALDNKGFSPEGQAVGKEQMTTLIEKLK